MLLREGSHSRTVMQPWRSHAVPDLWRLRRGKHLCLLHGELRTAGSDSAGTPACRGAHVDTGPQQVQDTVCLSHLVCGVQCAMPLSEVCSLSLRRGHHGNELSSAKHTSCPLHARLSQPHAAVAVFPGGSQREWGAQVRCDYPVRHHHGQLPRLHRQGATRRGEHDAEGDAVQDVRPWPCRLMGRLLQPLTRPDPCCAYQDINGKDVQLSSFKGKVVLMTNVASACGYTVCRHWLCFPHGAEA